MVTRHQQQLALQLAGGASQCWLNRKVRYRPPGEVFNPRSAALAPIDESTANKFVQKNHYAGTYPAARFRAGIYIKEPFRRERMGGRAVLLVPMANAVITRWLDLLSLDGEGQGSRGSTVATGLAHRLEPCRLLATMIEVARLLDADDGSRLALHDDVDAQGAIARGDLVLTMQVLQAATPIPRLDFRSRSNAFYEQVNYPFTA